jgi:small-conductance mechanosensitive channel
MNLSFDQSWFTWGLGLIIGFPLIVIVIGEISHHLEKARSRSIDEWAHVFRFIQRFIIPQLVLLLILTKILELPVDHVLVKIVETLLWIFIIYIAISLVNLLLFSDSGDSSWKIKAPKLLLDVARVIVVAFGAAIVLSSVWGFELGKMLAALGVGSIVLGLALQDTLSSLLSGFSLISSRQFKEGDWLQVGEHTGQVINVNWRSVTLLNRDEDIILIPNSELANGKFVNFSNPYPQHIERINFDFSFDDAPYKVKQVLIDAAMKTEGILQDPPPTVILVSYDEFTIRHQISFHIAHYVDLPTIKNHFMSCIWYAAKREGITFPTRSHEVSIIKPKPATEPEYKSHLKTFMESPLFRDKDIDLLTEMAKHSHKETYGTHEYILEQGKSSDDFFMLLTGEAFESYTDITGCKHNIRKIRSGDFFGLVSLVKDEPDRTSIIATQDSEILHIEEAHTHALFEKEPDLSSYIEQIIEKANRELNDIEAKASSD